MKAAAFVDLKQVFARVRVRAKGRCECTGRCGTHHTRCTGDNHTPGLLLVQELDDDALATTENVAAMCQECFDWLHFPTSKAPPPGPSRLAHYRVRIPKNRSIVPDDVPVEKPEVAPHAIPHGTFSGSIDEDQRPKVRVWNVYEGQYGGGRMVLPV